MSHADGQRTSDALPGRGAPGPRELPFALRFDRGRGMLVLADVQVGAARVHRLELDIPGLTFPFDLSAGRDGLRDRWLRASRLELSLPAAALVEAFGGATEARDLGLSDLSVSVERDALEVVGRIDRTETRSWFALRYLPDVAEGRDLLLRPGLFVLLGPPDLPMQAVALAVGRLAEPFAERRGLDLLVRGLPADLLVSLMPPHGYRVPDHRPLRLHGIGLSPSGLVLRYSSSGPPPAPPSEEAARLAEVAELLAPGDGALEAGRPEEARGAYLEALAREPDHPVVLERLAWLDAASASGAESAEAACGRHLGRQEHSGLRAVAASLALARGAVAEARLHLDRVSDRLGPGGRARVLVHLGRLELESDPGAAAVRFEGALAASPDMVEALEALQAAYALAGSRGQLEAVGARLVAALRAPGDRAAALAAQGELWLQRFDEPERASRFFERALVVAPDSTRALLGLAECRAAAGDLHGGLRCLDAVAARAAAEGLAELEARAHERAGRLWAQLGELQSAASRFHRAAELDSASLAALEGGALADAALGRHAMADSGYRRLARLAGEADQAEVWRRAMLGLARLHLDGLGSTQGALPVVDRLVEALPSDPEVAELAERLRPAPPKREVPEREAPREPAVFGTTPAGAEVTGLEDLDALLEAQAKDPADLPTARRLADALEARGDYGRSVAVLAALSERAEEPGQRAAVLVRMSEALATGMDDPESAADCLLEAARLEGPPAGASHARRAAGLLASAGRADDARRALVLAASLSGGSGEGGTGEP